MITAVGLLDEIFEHHLGDIEVGNHTIFHRLDRHDVSGCPAQHFFGLVPNRKHLLVISIERHNRRLIDYDPAPFCENERVGRTEINCQIA